MHRQDLDRSAAASVYLVFHRMLFAYLFLALVLTTHPAHCEQVRGTTVGVSATIAQLVLPGSELEAKPLEDRDSPIVLRVTGAFRHGTAYRYDMVYYGLEPGRFDLRDYLRRKDGAPVDDLPEMAVTIHPVLPPGQVEPNQLESGKLPFLGGYRVLLVLGALVWIGGLLAILFVGRGKTALAGGSGQRQLTLADRLRPIVAEAIAGRLTLSQQAELERMLLAVWRKRLDLNDVKAAEAIVVLRQHEEAGPLLVQLEEWLHRPGDASQVDVGQLLAPYRNLPADAPETSAVS